MFVTVFSTIKGWLLLLLLLNSIYVTAVITAVYIVGPGKSPLRFILNPSSSFCHCPDTAGGENETNTLYQTQ